MADDGLMTGIGGWVAQPFKQQMDLIHWALFVVLVVTIAYLWVNGVLKPMEI